MKLYVAYNNKCEDLINALNLVIPSKYALIELISFNEDIYKERSKAFKTKGSFSARMTPFAVLYDNDEKAVRAFYSENNGCKYEDIISILDKYTPYED